MSIKGACTEGYICSLIYSAVLDQVAVQHECKIILAFFSKDFTYCHGNFVALKIESSPRWILYGSLWA